jgi:hypothetical protein
MSLKKNEELKYLVLEVMKKQKIMQAVGESIL